MRRGKVRDAYLFAALLLPLVLRFPSFPQQGVPYRAVPVRFLFCLSSFLLPDSCTGCTVGLINTYLYYHHHHHHHYYHYINIILRTSCALCRAPRIISSFLLEYFLVPSKIRGSCRRSTYNYRTTAPTCSTLITI